MDENIIIIVIIIVIIIIMIIMNVIVPYFIILCAVPVGLLSRRVVNCRLAKSVHTIGESRVVN